MPTLKRNDELRDASMFYPEEVDKVFDLPYSPEQYRSALSEHSVIQVPLAMHAIHLHQNAFSVGMASNSASRSTEFSRGSLGVLGATLNATRQINQAALGFVSTLFPEMQVQFRDRQDLPASLLTKHMLHTDTEHDTIVSTLPAPDELGTFFISNKDNTKFEYTIPPNNKDNSASINPCRLRPEENWRNINVFQAAPNHMAFFVAMGGGVIWQEWGQRAFIRYPPPPITLPNYWSEDSLKIIPV